jgi:hypothetical protein
MSHYRIHNKSNYGHSGINHRRRAALVDFVPTDRHITTYFQHITTSSDATHMTTLTITDD